MQTTQDLEAQLRTTQVLEDDLAHVLVPWRRQAGARGAVIEGAQGCYFHDSEGKRYLDLSSQFVFANFGHGHPTVISAIESQLHQLPVVASQFPTAARADAARMLAEVTPGDLNRVFFSTSGAEANEAAIKMARDLTGRQLLCSRYSSYHGSTFGAMTLSRDPRSWPFEPGIPGVIYAPVCNPYRCHRSPAGGCCQDCGEHCARELEAVLLEHSPKRVAAVIVEPIVGANGVIVPGDGYLQTLREICDRWGILLICDEVMTGFGRTGKWFASDHYGVVPDMMTLAKGLTGGYVPLAATVVRESLARTWDDRPLMHGHTYSGHALGCAAAVAAIEVYRDEQLIARAAEIGEYLLERATELMESHPSVGDVRGKGLFVGIELVRNRQSKEPMVDPNRPPTGPSAKDQVIAEAMSQGVFLLAGQASVLTLAPPLVVNTDDIDFAMSVLDGALALADAEAFE